MASFKTFPTDPPLPRVRIVVGPTPAHALATNGLIDRDLELFIKREDLTGSVYGGNKVRNLEFILGDAIHQGRTQVVTVGPRGSNFVAALAAHSAQNRLQVQVYQFTADQSEQMDLHDAFSKKAGASIHLSPGGRALGLARALLAATRHLATHRHDSYWISPGGSNALGVVGHINTCYELSVQISEGEIPKPDLIVVGVGTCGTMAGLLAGMRLTGLDIPIVGVRCVDAVVCNTLRVAQLANTALHLLQPNSEIRFSPYDVDLRDLQSPIRYGRPLEEALHLQTKMQDLHGIFLDTTYTSKVFLYLTQRAHEFRGKKVLYWNTFSPAAMNLDSKEHSTAQNKDVRMKPDFKSLASIPSIRQEIS